MTDEKDKAARQARNETLRRQCRDMFRKQIEAAQEAHVPRYFVLEQMKRVLAEEAIREWGPPLAEMFIEGAVSLEAMRMGRRDIDIDIRLEEPRGSA